MHCFTQASINTKEGIVKNKTKMSTDLLTGHKKNTITPHEAKKYQHK